MCESQSKGRIQSTFQASMGVNNVIVHQNARTREGDGQPSNRQGADRKLLAKLGSRHPFYGARERETKLMDDVLAAVVFGLVALTKDSKDVCL